MALQVHVYPMFSDNYGFVVVDEDSGDAAVVDPGDAEATIAEVEKHDIRLRAIWNTHHHADHAGGNERVLQHFGALPVFASAYDRSRIPGVTSTVADGDTVQLGATNLNVLDVPAHTKGHIAYLGDDKLFCGDTLFVGGCGRLFEGTAEQMYHALNEVFAILPDTTEVYCAHEYTQNNLAFAMTVEPGNEAVLQLAAKAGSRTVPSTIGAEKEHNPFMRCHAPEILASVKEAFPGRRFSSPVDVLAAIRELKDRF